MGPYLNLEQSTIVGYSRLPIFGLPNTILGNQKVSNERAM
jgi:hypothetical protein